MRIVIGTGVDITTKDDLKKIGQMQHRTVSNVLQILVEDFIRKEKDEQQKILARVEQ